MNSLLRRHRALAIGGVAAHAVATKLTGRGKRSLIERMATLHGLPQKIVQMLGLRDLEESGCSSTLVGLPTYQELTLAEVEQMLRDELGPEKWAHVASVDRQAMSASIGQVHKAQLTNGTTVAFKIQYPGIADTIRKDLTALGLLLSPLSSRVSGFSLSDYRACIGSALARELDYEQERETIETFARYFSDDPLFSFPLPLLEYCTSRVLCLRWIAGVDLSRSLRLSGEQRADLALLLTRFFFRSWLGLRLVHGDPNPGNYLVDTSHGGVTLGIIDFGCCWEVPLPSLQAVHELVTAGGDISPQRALACLEALGFDLSLLASMDRKLPAVIALLTEPFRAEAAFDFSHWNLGTRMTDLLGDDRWTFRFAGPPTMLLWIRSLAGLVRYLQELKVSVPFGLEYQRWVPPAIVRPDSIEPTPPPPSSHQLLSTKLQILVTEDGRDKVHVTMKADCVERLRDLVPDEVLPLLAAQSIDVDAISQRTVNAHCPPGPLFSAAYGSRQIRIWLE